MMLCYLPQYNGKIIKALYDRDIFAYDMSTMNPAHLTMTIDESEASNKAVCIDIINTQECMDANGLSKYYVSAGVLMERAGLVGITEVL